MNERRKDSHLESLDKMQGYQEFLEKYAIRQHMKIALLKVVENRPEHPMLFLANYFDSISTDGTTDKIARTRRTLSLSHHSQPMFQNNLILAYDILSAPKNPTSKKLANKRAGLTGSVHEELLKSFCEDVPAPLAEILLQKICCRWNEMVPYEVFRYSMTVVFVLQDFLNLSKDLFIVLSGKNENSTERCLCNAALNSFKEAICQSAAVNSNKVFEAGRRLRPDYLAIEMLDSKDNGKDPMEMEDFVQEMSVVFLQNVKCVR